MKCLIGLGANLGDRHQTLERAAQALARWGPLRASPLFESAALLPPGAPAEWSKQYLNGVLELDWRGQPGDLLDALKNLEAEIGRRPAERWAPRVIDLDILTFADQIVRRPGLSIPHNEWAKRSFVLTPLKHLCAGAILPEQTKSLLQLSRALPGPLPLWMGILNLSPDSFAEVGLALEEKLAAMEAENIQLFDLGAESTRPGATPISAEEEWRRLEPALRILRERFAGRVFRPRISVDTYRAATAHLSLKAGADWINDVSGLGDPAMIDVLREFGCDYVLMHNLGVPADPHRVLSGNPVEAVRAWAERKLGELERAGIGADRVIFDPGIGFGKTPEQSLTLLRSIETFMDLPVRLAVGHSRKSFLNLWRPRTAVDRDPETTGVSLRLASAGIDILRVHAPAAQARAFRLFQESFS